VLQNRTHDGERKLELLLKGANVNWKAFQGPKQGNFNANYKRFFDTFIRKLENGLCNTSETIGSHCIHEDSAARSQTGQ
jgi:hypothetical protein